MVLTRAQRAADLFISHEWPRVYDDVLAHWLQYFTTPLDTLQSRGIFNMVLTSCSRFMVRDFNKYISNLAVKKRVQSLKYEFYEFMKYIEQPGVQFAPEHGKVKVSPLYWDQYRAGRKVSTVH